MSSTILYVEDEPLLARLVQDGLTNSGYVVHWVVDGAQALIAYRTYPPDLCLLDVRLRGQNGYSLAQTIRAANPTVPILFLSAGQLTEDVVQGFRSGGNDYLKKPFVMDELLVRIEALLHRARPPQPSSLATLATTYHVQGCTLDVVRQQLHTPTGVQLLSCKETALLALLLEQRNQVLTRQEALLRIWGDDSHYNARSMDVFISHLRKQLKALPGVELLTMRGVGYKLVC